MTKLDWENITNYIDSVGTTDTIFPFVKVQSGVKVTASGARDNIIYTIGGQSGTLSPGQSVTVTGSISSMTLRSASGKQPFQVWATEAGTEKEQAEIGLASQLTENANQDKLSMLMNNLSIQSDTVALQGYQGNSSAYAYMPVSLNGVYDVEFLIKSGNLTTLHSILDFRYNGGVGSISQNTDGTIIKSAGMLYLDRIEGGNGGKLTDTNLHLLELKAMPITATRAYILATNGGSNPTADFISRIKIYDHDLGTLLYEWNLDETAGTAVVDNNGNDDGVITNTYSGLFASLNVSKIPASYRYATYLISKFKPIDIMITHDDGYKEMKSIVAPLLQANNMVANIGVVKSWVLANDLTHMNLQELSNIRDSYGFGIVNHTENHQSIGSLAVSDPTTAYNEVYNNRIWLNSNGFDGDYFIYPYSGGVGYSPKAANIVKNAGIKMARTPSDGIQPFPPLNLVGLIPQSGNLIYDDNYLTRFYTRLDEAIAKRGIIIPYFHNVKSDANASADGYNNVIGLTAYTKVINRLKKLNVKTLTMKQFYDKYFGS